MSKIWSVILLISVGVAIVTGVPGTVISAITENSKSAVNNIITMCGMMCFWSGIFHIFEQTSLVDKMSKLISGIVGKIFHKNEVNEEAKKYISMNIATNVLGIGNASTIHGLKAMKEMDEINKQDKPNNSMTKFVLLNTASVQLIPTSMISLRMLYNSAEPTKIVLPVLIVTGVSLVVGMISISILNRCMR